MDVDGAANTEEREEATLLRDEGWGVEKHNMRFYLRAINVQKKTN